MYDSVGDDPQLTAPLSTVAGSHLWPLAARQIRARLLLDGAPLARPRLQPALRALRAHLLRRDRGPVLRASAHGLVPALQGRRR